ncbi:MAG: adenylate/guanylate cyclase domain-containing protein [Acidobacteriota bacterium]
MRLIFTDAAGQIKEYLIDLNSVLIGRNLPLQPDYIDLKDGKVSSQHARLTFENDEFWVEDLGSTNGTWVGKKKIKAHLKTRLTLESTLLVGQTTIKVEVTPPSPSGAPPKPPSGASPVPAGFTAEPLVSEAPAESIEAAEPLPNQFLAGESLEAARLRLTAVYELSESLGEIDNLEFLSSTILDHLHRTFRQRGRHGHSGLLVGENLVLKAFRPEDEPPTCSLTLARHVLTNKKGCLWQIDTPDGVGQSVSLISAGVRSAMYVPLIWKGEVQGVLYLDETSPRYAFDLDDLRLLQIMATQAAMFIKNLSLQQVIQREAVVKARLLAQFPKTIAERMARQPSRLTIVSERVETATVLFTDVRGFTKLSSAMEPEHIVQMLNDMFHDLTPIILKHNGTVDKYIGDAVLAVFGSPDPDEQQWEHAVEAALEIQAAIKHLAAGRWLGRTAFPVGIGIHTGPVIHGFIGAPERMEYTVIGSTINAASRYCNASGPGEILISPATYARLHHRLEVEHPAREIDTKHEGKLKAYLVRGWKARKNAAL